MKMKSMKGYIYRIWFEGKSVLIGIFNHVRLQFDFLFACFSFLNHHVGYPFLMHSNFSQIDLALYSLKFS